MGLWAFLYALVVVAKPLGDDAGNSSSSADDEGLDNCIEAESSISGEFESNKVQSYTKLPNEACATETQQSNDFTNKWCDDDAESGDESVVTQIPSENNTARTRVTHASMYDFTRPHNKWDVANTRTRPSSSPELQEELRFTFADQSGSDLTMDARISAMPVRRHFPTRQTVYQHLVNEAVVIPEDIKRIAHSDKDTADAIHKTDYRRPSDTVEEMKKAQPTNTYNSKRAADTSDRDIRDREVDECIRQLLNGRTPSRRENFYDAAVVYERDDYAEVIEFIREVKRICSEEMTDEPRIELFDSEVFNQSQIAVVEDLFRRCSILFVYLTPSCSSRHFQYVVEEAIGLSRLDLSSATAQDTMFRQRECVVKPVQTEPMSTRSYKTPIGLVTQKGLEWYNRYSEHTKAQVRQMMKAAHMERKRNEGFIFPMKTIDSSATAHTFVPERNTSANAGNMQQCMKQPQRHQGSFVSEDVISFESGHWDMPLMSTPVSEEPNRQELDAFSRRNNDRLNLSREGEDSFSAHYVDARSTSLAAPVQRFSSPAGPFSHAHYSEIPDRYNVHENQYSNQQGRLYLPGNVMSAPRNQQFVNEYPTSSQQIPFQSARIHSSGFSRDGPRSETSFEQRPIRKEPVPNFSSMLSPEVQTFRRSYSNEASSTIGVGENNTSIASQYIPVINKSSLKTRNLRVPISTLMQQHQSAIRRTVSHDEQGARGSSAEYTPVQSYYPGGHEFNGRHVQQVAAGRDMSAPIVPADTAGVAVSAGFVSDTASSAISQPPLESAASNLSVVSKVTGKLIINNNLSTDDIEIDSGRKHRPRKAGKTKKSRSRSRSVSSSSDESDSDCEGRTYRGRKSRSKTINIVGSSIVQLGKHNAVHKTKPRSDKRVATKLRARDAGEDFAQESQRKKKSEVRVPSNYQRTTNIDFSNEQSLNEDQMSISISGNLIHQHPSKHLPDKNMSIRDHRSMEDGELHTSWQLMSDLKENGSETGELQSECSFLNQGYVDDENNQKGEVRRQTNNYWNNFDDNESPTENNCAENCQFKSSPSGDAANSTEPETEVSSAEQPVRDFRLINPLIAYVTKNIVPVSVDTDELD